MLCQRTHARKQITSSFISRPFRSASSLRPIELLVQQMQEEVDIQSHNTLEQIHILVIGELGSQQRVHWNLGAGTGDLNASLAAFDEENSDFVAGYGEINLIPFPITVAFP